MTEKKAAKRSAITAVLSVLWTLAMGAVIVTILAAPEAAPASPEEEAAGNLQLLQDALERMQASGKVPTSLGGTFWKEVADAEDATAALVSSAAALQGFTGATSVRGPSRPYAQIEETGVVACERAGSLPGATVVLYKNGTIETVGEQTDAYRRAITETQE